MKREHIHIETDERGINYRLFVEQDQTEVRGNASACGDDEYDRNYENEILTRLNFGDIWAWAVVTVEAEYEGFTGADVLGACTYRNTEEFLRGDYYRDMKHEAEIALIENTRQAVAKGRDARRVLRHLEK